MLQYFSKPTSSLKMYICHIVLISRDLRDLRVACDLQITLHSLLFPSQRYFESSSGLSRVTSASFAESDIQQFNY